MSLSFIWPLLAASVLIHLNQSKPFHRTSYGTALFVLGALSGALSVMN